ncbi:hypothetical protein BDQ17DRAFT_1242411 [Cyathus striatus]|nr:hypothetical protein BDQ17DRAFT_1242411 [Cyathus striatus]
MSSENHKSSDGRSNCTIFEILQFTCELKPVNNEMSCYPIARLFRQCPGEPVTEITTAIKIDMATGEVEMPPQLSSIKGRPWREILAGKDSTS